MCVGNCFGRTEVGDEQSDKLNSFPKQSHKDRVEKISICDSDINLQPLFSDKETTACQMRGRSYAKQGRIRHQICVLTVCY
jgi:hypothetical protein